MPEQFTNALAAETSPYLLQHAHNPVNWYPWSDEALELARKEDKPILVSIGYSACHWCHVMERESFEDETVAAFMNNHFINIKIDREERPDLDLIYMDAVQAMTGSGGWPLNVFLTPDAKPFYGGTYFPPVKMYNRPSWMDVLSAMAGAWKSKRSDMEEQAGSLVKHISDSNLFYEGDHKGVAANSKDEFNPSMLRNMNEAVMKMADKEYGGFGRAPKFPQTFTIQFLLSYAHFFKDDIAMGQAELSLTRMLHGGIYDQLAGGLARYSTDHEWLAPHFEKMLYDNAQLISVLCDAYQLTGKGLYKNYIEKTLQFLQTEMQHPDGGFYAALDADSEGEEGKFYTWDFDEVTSILGEDADIVCGFYNITVKGNWEGKNIIRIQEDEHAFAEKWNMSLHELKDILSRANKLLLQARGSRIRPQTDDKIILGWNALLLTAMCKAYAALGEESYRESAVALFDFLKEKFFVDHAFRYHTYKNGQSKNPAFLDDLAFLIQSCISLQEITSNQQYLFEAKQITEYVMQYFEDEQTGMFFYTSADQQDVIARKIDVFDNATASGNSIMALNLHYLSVVFDHKEWAAKSENMLSRLVPMIVRHPSSFGIWAGMLANKVVGTEEIVVTGSGFEPLLKKILSGYIPNKVLQSSDKENGMPLFINRNPSPEARIYVCRNYQCEAPVKSYEEFLLLIKNHMDLT